MRIINLLVVVQIWNENWRYLQSKGIPKPEFKMVCRSDKECNRFQHESGFQCSICAEDKDGNGRCLSSFFHDGLFLKQCKISPSCSLNCPSGDTCELGGKKFQQTCYCRGNRFGRLCTTQGKGFTGLRMLLWNRENLIIKPGEKTRFYYRSVGDAHVIENGLYRMFITSFGHTSNPGEAGKKGMTSPWPCTKNAGVLCTGDHTDLQFPYLLPNNEYGVTVLKMKDKLKGYLAHIKGQFKSASMNQFVNYYFTVFVNYEKVPVLKCVPVIKLTNCAREYTGSSNFSFHRSEYIQINYNYRFLEDGAYLSKTKENLQICSPKDTIWTWTWTRVIREHGLSTHGDKNDVIGKRLKFLPFTLGYGIYRASLRIKRVLSVSTNENFDECYFSVKPLPLEASIDGGEFQKVIKATGFTLSATNSYDPNEPFEKQDSLKILWTCECLTKEIPNCENSCKFNKKEPYKWMGVHERFFVHPENLQYGAEYKFTMELQSTLSVYSTYKDISPQFSHITVKVANESEKTVINYHIECYQNCDKGKTLPNEILFLKAKSFGIGEASLKDLPRKKLDWLYAKKNEFVHGSMNSIKLDGLPSSMLAIKEGSFEQGVTYSVMLTDRNSSEFLAEYTFTTDSMKYEGNCQVEPQTGTKGLSDFDITCDGVDSLIFEFYDKSDKDLEEKEVFNGRMLGTSEFVGSLKGVKLTRGNVAVYIIKKDSGLYSTRILKVELSPWNISAAVMTDFMKNLTAAARQQDFETTQKYVSVIADILPEWVDKTEMFKKLLDFVCQSPIHQVKSVKLSTSSMQLVLQAFNKPKPLSLDLELIWTTLKRVRRQLHVMEKVAQYREVSQWMSSQEVRQITRTLIDNLNIVIMCEDTSTAGHIEINMGFETFFVLKEMAQETEHIIEGVKNILTCIQAPGMLPSKLASSDESFQIWIMGNDEDHTVTKMLKHIPEIPIYVSKSVLRAYTKEKEHGADTYFQVASIQRNLFSWSQSDVKSKLVSLTMVHKYQYQYQVLEKVSLLPAPVDVWIEAEKDLTNTTVKGFTQQLDPHLDPVECDMRLKIHRIDSPPKALTEIFFLFPPTTGSLRVLLMEDYRPDCELMMKSAYTVNSSHSTFDDKKWSVDAEVFLYLAVMPGVNVPVNETVAYEFQVSITLCQLWIDSQWSSLGCEVAMRSTLNETVCACNHLSIIAAAFPVPPQSIDPFGDAKLFLTVLDNPLVVVFVSVLLVIYVLLALWGRHQDNVDALKGKVIVLDDNFPDDEFPYLVAVHTSSRYNAGTTAHVGIELTGRNASSRAHILSCQWRKVLKRDSDDWFIIFTSKSLGEVYEIQIWHDNAGSSPEWYCDKIVVYDLINNTEALFIVEQWLALQEGDYPEAILVLATDNFSIKRMFLDNAVIGFRDSHTFLSVFTRHPRSKVTRVQRVSILMCFILVAMLCSIMFYKPPGSSRIDDYHYSVGMRELIISVETVVLTGLLTMVVLLSFRRSYKSSHRRRRTTHLYRKDGFEENKLQVSPLPENKDKTFYDNYVHFVSKYLKNPPLAPVYVGHGEQMLERRKIWYIIAWFSCVVVMIGAAYFVMLYGLKLGKVQSQKWLTSLIMSVGEDVFVLTPGKIISVALILSVAFQISTKVDIHRIELNEVMAVRPRNDIDYLSKLMTKRNHPMYFPLSSSAREALMEQKVIRRKYWCLIDFANIVVFVIVVSAVVYRLWTSHYHLVEQLRLIFSDTHTKEFESVNIEDIRNISMVEDYFEVNLFEILFNLVWYNGVSMNMHECSIVYFEGVRYCLLKWSLSNKDTNVYGENWLPATYFDSIKKDSPWKYRDRSTALWWANQRFYGSRSDLYDVSGYLTTIGPTMKEAQKILDEMRENKWQDWFTRACYLSSTVFNVNDKVFSQVTILFEYFVDGSMSSTITVIPVSRAIVLGVWEFLFLFYSIYYIFRSGYLINRMGLMDYLKNLSNSTRVLGVFLSFVAIAVWCVHHSMSIKYAEKYMKTKNNEYFDFDQFASTFYLLQTMLSLMMCLVFARMFLLLQGGRRFLNVYYTLIVSRIWLVWLTLGTYLALFVLSCLQYFLQCQIYFRAKELIIFQHMSNLLHKAALDENNIQMFVLIRVVSMQLVKVLFVLFFLYYARIAKVYKLRVSDSFDFVSFIAERIKKCCGQKKFKGLKT